MRREELVRALLVRPFHPFRLYLSDGGTFEIRHPEMLMVSRHSAIVGIVEQGENGNSGEGYPEIEGFTTMDLMHVTRIEDLQHRSA
ncbi:MAG: hypothetical protein ABSG68_25255 [Thermoguttaceae bacterium]